MVHPQAWRAEDTMTGALIGLLLLGLAGPMEVLGEDDEARFEVDFTRVVRDRDLVSLTLHMTPKTDRGYAVAHADIRVDCAAQTFTFTAFRAFDDADAPLRSADVPVERQRAEPIYEGPVWGDLYQRVCPGGTLQPPPPPAPPPVAVPPERQH